MAWTELTRRQHARVGDKYASDLTDPEWGSVWMPPVLQGFPELISSDLIAVVYSASCCGFYAPRAMMVSSLIGSNSIPRAVSALPLSGFPIRICSIDVHHFRAFLAICPLNASGTEAYAATS